MDVAIAPWTAWVGEAIGLAALVALVLFAVTYQTHADWKSTRPGRAIMHLVRGLIATIVLLILTGFVHFGPWRWIVEAVVYAPIPTKAAWPKEVSPLTPVSSTNPSTTRLARPT